MVLFCVGDTQIGITQFKAQEEIVCFGTQVYLYNQRKIIKNIPGNGTWIQSHTLPTVRHYHSSWTPASGTGTYLLGGGASEYTSDLVKPDGTVEKTFNLKHKTV